MKKNLLLLFACTTIQLSASAQTSGSAALNQKLNSYLQNNFQEKIYVHTDKNSYVAGEIIWFKLFNTEAYTNLPVNNSKVAYLEILNAENRAVLQTKVELTEGGGSGSLYLPVTLPSGAYVLRSYTNWMKNFDASYYFHKDLSIYNTVKEEEITAKPASEAVSIQFFPEGGNLVAGINSRVAFKAVGVEGRGIDFRGAILGSRNDTVAKFRPQKDGIGTLFFKPEKGQEYKVAINPVGERPFSATLPQIYEKGAVMSILSADSVLNVAVSTNLENENRFTLFVHSGHRVVLSETITTDGASGVLKVPVRLLGDGISHFTLFNSAQKPLCERLYFKKPSKFALIDVSTDRQEYSSRERANVTIKHSANGRPLNSNFSIAVYPADSLSNQDEDIVTNLWLTSELKGKVQNASSYLKNYSQEAIDNLMLTHGWRRFKWEDVLETKKQEFKYIPELQGHIISGRIVNSETKLPVSGQNVYLSVPDRRLQLYTAYSNENGDVHFFTRNFNSTSGIVAQVDPRMDSLARIEINSPFSSSFASYRPAKFNARPDQESLLQRSVAMQVNNAFYAKQLNKEYVPVVDSTGFYFKPDKVYKLDNYVRFKTMEEVLREYVTEISVALRKKDYHLSVYDAERREFHSGAPLILIDGVPVFDEGNAAIKYDPLKVQRLEVVTSAYVYGNNIFPGIASFHTYKGDLGGLELPRQATVLDYEGLQNKREFYSPMYDGDATAFSRLPDYRTTLFWNADNQTNKDGTASVNFFTSDLPGKYYVVVQSLSKDGYAGSQVAEFNVNRRTISQVGDK